MKKYFLTALLGAFCLFGFTSATSYTFLGDLDDSVYSPNSFTLTEDYTFSVSDISNMVYFSEEGFCDLALDDSSSDTTNPDCQFSVSEGNSIYSIGSCTFSAGTVYVGRSDGSVCQTVTLSVGGSSGGGSSSSGILNSTGQAYLGNVISGISSIVSEFIPYMIYVALAVLVATLGFVAVKRLMNYTSKRVTGLFSSRRRK